MTLPLPLSDPRVRLAAALGEGHLVAEFLGWEHLPKELGYYECYLLERIDEATPEFKQIVDLAFQHGEFIRLWSGGTHPHVSQKFDIKNNTSIVILNKRTPFHWRPDASTP